ncbi:hypothetical protein U1Q18_009927 [Sarracenia purpurea var. burkii]
MTKKVPSLHFPPLHLLQLTEKVPKTVQQLALLNGGHAVGAVRLQLARSLAAVYPLPDASGFVKSGLQCSVVFADFEEAIRQFRAVLLVFCMEVAFGVAPWRIGCGLKAASFTGMFNGFIAAGAMWCIVNGAVICFFWFGDG